MPQKSTNKKRTPQSVVESQSGIKQVVARRNQRKIVQFPKHLTDDERKQKKNVSQTTLKPYKSVQGVILISKPCGLLCTLIVLLILL